MKQYPDKPDGASPPKLPKSDPFFKGMPALEEALTHRFFDDGKPREPWVMTVSFETGQAMCKVSDKWSRRTAQCIAHTVYEAMQLLNEQIATGTLAWRQWGKESRR